MSEEKSFRIVEESDLGRDLDEQECQALVAVMDVKRLEDGEVLVAEGETDEALHLLASGELDVTTKGEGGEEAHLHTMKAGELAGAMGFVDGLPRTATLRARGGVVVYSLERGVFETLIDSRPRMVYHIMRAVTRTAHGAMLGLNVEIEELTNYVVKQHGRY